MAGKLTGPTASKASSASTPIPLATDKILCVESQLEANSTDLSKRDEHIPQIRVKRKGKRYISKKKIFNHFPVFLSLYTCIHDYQ